MTDASVAALSDGGFVISFTRAFSSDTDINAQVFNADGSFRSAALTVDGSVAFSSRQSSVAAITGGFVVVWSHRPAAGGDSQLLFERYNNAGEGSSNVPVSGGGDNIDPKVIGLADGGFAVAYTTTAFNSGANGQDLSLIHI